MWAICLGLIIWKYVGAWRNILVQILYANYAVIGSYNALSPDLHQVIILPNVDMVIGPLGMN